MSDFNDKKDGDIKSRLDGNVEPASFKKSSEPGAGKQANKGAESLRPSVPRTPKTKNPTSQGQGLFKSPSNPGPIQSDGVYQKVDRPGSLNVPKVRVGSSGRESSLMDLQAKIPNFGQAKKLDLGQPGANKGNDLSKLASSNYNTKIKDKFALSLRYRIPSKLEKLIDKDPEILKKLSSYIAEQINMNQSNREEMLERIWSFRESWRNFESAGLNIDIDGQHNEHIPLIFEKGKSLHARIYSAIMSVEPPFVALPRKAVSAKMKSSKESLLRWVTSDYINKGQGIAVETDKDIWNYVFDGTAIVKHGWERDVRKFIDVKSEPKLPLELDENGQLVMEETEEEKEVVTYDGPTMKVVPLEDMYIIGAKAEDIDDADMVAHRQYFTKSDIIKLANLGYFMQDAVDQLLTYTPDTSSKVQGYDTTLSQQEARLSGVMADKGGIPNYVMHECHLRYDIDKDGIDEEIVVWREWNTGIITRITFLDRVSPTGKRPFVLKKLIPMSGSCYGLGFGEMLFGINNLLDYIANQRLDAGTFNTFPWFVYRAGSGLQDSDIRLAPGKGIPLDSVQDIAFPKVNGNSSYGFQEEALVTEYGERVSGIPRWSQGQMGGQGMARTATGAASLVSELNTNLDIFIKRYQFGFKKSLRIIDKQCQELLPLGLEYRVLGSDSEGEVYKRFADRESIKWDCDFELVGNSVNSNPAIERDTAVQLLQYSLNPVMLQSGIVGPKQIYNAMKNLLQKLDVRDIGSFIQSPDGIEGPEFTAQDEINAIAAGIELPVRINDDHAKKLAYYDAFENSPEFGFLTQDHIPLYSKMKAKHQQYADAIAAQNMVANNSLGLPDAGLAAQIAAGSGAPNGVAQQITDLAPQSSPTVNGQEGQ